MEPVLTSDTDSRCFRFMSSQELQLFRSEKKFLLTASDFGDTAHQAAEKKEKLFVVPNQFPFVFELADSGFARGSEDAIQKTLKKLNTLRRIQIVRSLVSRRIITSNLREMQDRSRFTGKVTIKQSDPLSGNELVVSAAPKKALSQSWTSNSSKPLARRESTSSKRV